MQVYEVGFHVVPTLTEEKASQKAAEFRSLIEKNNGTVISEGAPQNQPLAYTLYKDVGSVRSKYDNAHFGWIKFEAPTTSIAIVKDAMDKDSEILRHIIIKTVRENTLHTPKVVVRAASEEKKSDDVSGVVATGAGTAVAGAPVSAAPMSIDEMDKTIDKMVTE